MRRRLLLPSLLAAALALPGAACADGEATPRAGDADASGRLMPLTPGEARELYGTDGVPPGAPASEFAGLDGWLNSAPLTVAELTEQGRVVLIDFWTYTCVNCIRTLPFLQLWHEKYADAGLTIVGVHSPEFDFERSPDNVARAAEELGVTWPVALDGDMETWGAWANNVWPAKYLVGADGTVAYVHFGEGDYEETEYAIRAALTVAGHDVGAIPVGGVEEPVLDPDVEGITRELYGGYERNFHSRGVYAGQEAYYEGPDQTSEYVDPGEYRNHQWYAHGLWTNEREAIVHARETTELEDYLRFRFVARSVNVVMHPAEDGAYEVRVELDGRAPTPEEAGADVAFDGSGRALVIVDEPRMYAVLELPALGEYVITLRSNAEGFSMYAVTFGAYMEGA